MTGDPRDDRSDAGAGAGGGTAAGRGDPARVAVLGGGAWGTALAVAARRAGARVRLWLRNPRRAEEVAETCENRYHLPGVRLPREVVVTSSLPVALEAETLLLAVPAQELRALARRLARVCPPGRSLVVCAKGIEQDSGKLMTEVIVEELPGRPLAVLTGPTFAGEVAAGLPTAVTLACGEPARGEALLDVLGSAAFRPYLSEDPVGAEIGGAVKNVIAIAAGIVAGRQLGDNARAALIARGLAEMMRLGLAKGARRETLMGLSGLGDLVLTCTSAQSRNYALGQALGEGLSLAEARERRGGVTEGVGTATAVVGLAARLGVEAPIAAAVENVVARGADIDETIEALLARPFKAELA